MNKKYLNLIIDYFVKKDRRDRLVALLESQKRYDDFLEELLRDPRYLDIESIIEIPSAEQTPFLIYRRMVDEGGRDPAYLVSTDLDLDGIMMDLEDAMEKIAGSGSETIIFCPDQGVGYYEGHEGWRYILRKKKS